MTDSTTDFPLNKEEIIEAFINSNLEENYNFIEEDLVKLANAFIKKAEDKIRLDEASGCYSLVVSMNKEVAEKLKQKRIDPRLAALKGCKGKVRMTL